MAASKDVSVQVDSKAASEPEVNTPTSAQHTNQDDNERGPDEATNNNNNNNNLASGAVDLKPRLSIDGDYGFDVVGRRESAPRAPDLPKTGYVRHMVAWLALSSIVLANMNRQAFNQSLPKMVSEPKTNSSCSSRNQPQNHTQADCEPSNLNLNLKPQLNATQSKLDQVSSVADVYDWDKGQIADVTKYFSIGYVLFMIPGARLCEIYGAKWVVFVSGFGSGLTSVTLPYLADNSFTLLIVSRFFMGLCQTAVSPALYAILYRWLTTDESLFYAPLIKLGVQGGFLLGSLISGFLPWRMAFYAVGAISLAWSACWALMVTSDPNDHRLVGESELDYIHQQIGVWKRKSSTKTAWAVHLKAEAKLWGKILRNPVVLTIMLTKFTIKLSTDVQTQSLPWVLKEITQVQSSLNGIINGSNYALQAILTLLLAYVAKRMVNSGSLGLERIPCLVGAPKVSLSKTAIRRLFQTICNFGMALGYVMIAFDPSSLATVLLAILILSVTNSFCAGADSVIPIDLSPEYSASIMAIANCSANLSGVVLPELFKFVVGEDRQSEAKWRFLLQIIATIVFLGGLTFLLFAKAEIQDFDPNYKPKEAKNKSKLKGAQTLDAPEHRKEAMELASITKM